MAQAGQALPLNDFADEFGWDQIFAPWALSLGIVDGQLYSVPHELETLFSITTRHSLKNTAGNRRPQLTR